MIKTLAAVCLSLLFAWFGVETVRGNYRLPGFGLWAPLIALDGMASLVFFSIALGWM